MLHAHIFIKRLGKLIGKSVITLQKWDRKGILHAYSSPTNRRYYTYEQYLQYRGLISSEQGKTVVATRVSSPSQEKDLATQEAAIMERKAKRCTMPGKHLNPSAADRGIFDKLLR
jgi:predicted site-specific integrase-resolvase